MDLSRTLPLLEGSPSCFMTMQTFYSPPATTLLVRIDLQWWMVRKNSFKWKTQDRSDCFETICRARGTIEHPELVPACIPHLHSALLDSFTRALFEFVVLHGLISKKPYAESQQYFMLMVFKHGRYCAGTRTVYLQSLHYLLIIFFCSEWPLLKQLPQCSTSAFTPEVRFR